jgi:hypothetical protein
MAISVGNVPGQVLTLGVTSDPSVSPGVAADVGVYATDGTYYWVKWGSGNTDWKLLAPDVTSNYVRARARHLTGAALLSEFASTPAFSSSVWSPFSSGSAVISSDTGWARLRTGTTAGSSAQHHSGGGYFGSIGAKRWYMASIFKFPSAGIATTQTAAAVGWCDTGGGLMVEAGYNGSAHSGNVLTNGVWSVIGNGLTPVVIPGTVDDAQHLVELWCDTTSIYGAIDGAASSALPAGSLALTTSYLVVRARNGGDAIEYEANERWRYMAWEVA